MFGKVALYETHDGEICLRDLLAAVSSDPVDCFLTMSCNQKDNTAVAGIMQSCV